ncbi:hypothetical protein SEA_ZOOMAN_318 [Microbacterium phage Zooman]|nr:hypothetical protein SEA_ZOOMAN_5 [Microbacterium phage Zooman]UDL16559.1 hypothetical protein SEA_ZOOMAN_318 [Microbacterium phage Zooman]
MRHIEIHFLESARDTALLETAGLPRYGDIEPARCGACKATAGEVLGANGAVAWRPFGVILDGETVTVACRKCLSAVDRALKA